MMNFLMPDKIDVKIEVERGIAKVRYTETVKKPEKMSNEEFKEVIETTAQFVDRANAILMSQCYEFDTNIEMMSEDEVKVSMKIVAPREIAMSFVAGEFLMQSALKNITLGDFLMMQGLIALYGKEGKNLVNVMDRREYDELHKTTD